MRLRMPVLARYALGFVLLLLLAALPLRPAQGTPAVCRIGVNIEDLYDLDMARDTFGAILWLWSVCPSPHLAPLGTIAFPTASGSLNLSPIETEPLASGGAYASRRVQGTFRYNWDMNHYPFDRQPVVIPMDEAQYGAARLVFEPDAASPSSRRTSATGWTNGASPT